MNTCAVKRGKSLQLGHEIAVSTLELGGGDVDRKYKPSMAPGRDNNRAISRSINI